MLLEPADGGASCASPLWTPAEWIAALTDGQRRFLEQSGLVASVVTVGAVGAQEIVRLPEDVALVLRAVWVTPEGAISALRLGSVAEVDFGPVGHGGHVERARPRYAVVSVLPARQLRLLPAPRDAGQVQLIAVRVGATPTGAGVELTIPGDWSEYLRYAVLAASLGKVGPAQDDARARYARARVEEGVTLARLLLDEASAGELRVQSGAF